MAGDRDTIAAIATPLGEGAIGVIRISGPDAFAILRRFATLPDPLESHRAYVRRLAHDGDVLDEALVLPFRGPRSFTGEDVVELHCHGGVITLRRVLDAVLDAGARTAEPGEFSRRALLNEKLDLVQVEAIADIIHARSEAAQRLAQHHLAGRLSSSIDALKSQLVELIVLVEAAIDFSLEEHVYTIDAATIAARLAPIMAGLQHLLATYDAGRLRHEGVRLAIVGPPNAGKSSLLNHLLDEERAIVTDVPGTTRDYLEEGIVIRGLLFTVIDTAGIRETADRVEALGVERSRKVVAGADAVLYIADASDPLPGLELYEELRASDLNPSAPWTFVWNKMDRVTAAPDEAPAEHTLEISISSGSGLGGLPDALLELAGRAGVRLDEDTVLISRARHRDALTGALERLDRALGASESGLEHELIALDLRDGLSELGSLTGAVTSDDVLNRIFGDFCIGK